MLLTSRPGGEVGAEHYIEGVAHGGSVQPQYLRIERDLTTCILNVDPLYVVSDSTVNISQQDI